MRFYGSLHRSASTRRPEGCGDGGLSRGMWPLPRQLASVGLTLLPGQAIVRFLLSAAWHGKTLFAGIERTARAAVFGSRVGAGAPQPRRGSAHVSSSRRRCGCSHASSARRRAGARGPHAALAATQMTAIINEVSGERAMHHILELVPYQRVRLPEEYNGPYRETRVIVDFAKEYGFRNVAVETFGAANQMAWQPTQGELWMTTPKSREALRHPGPRPLARVAQRQRRHLRRTGGRRPGTRGGLRGQGREGQVRALLRHQRARHTQQAVQRGAIGVLGISAIGFQRSQDFPNQIVSSNVNAQPGTVAWSCDAGSPA